MIQEGKIKNDVDMKLEYLTDYKWKHIERVIIISFYYIKEDGKVGPSMNKVILMLEGHTKVEDPPLYIAFLMRTRARISSHPS